jgi:hypothetical protein
MANRLYNKQVTPKGYKRGGTIPMKRTQKAVGGIAAKLGKEGLKYLKNNPDKVKKIMDSPLPKKTKNLLSKMKKTFEKKK